MLKIVVAGSRSFNNYNLFERMIIKDLFELNKKYPQYNLLTIDQIKNLYKINRENFEVISGMANGADSLAVKFARKFNLKLIEFPAKWNDLSATPCKVVENIHGKYNALAGHNRNR